MIIATGDIRLITIDPITAYMGGVDLSGSVSGNGCMSLSSHGSAMPSPLL